MNSDDLRIALLTKIGWSKTGLERDSVYWTDIPLNVYFKLGEDERIKQRTCTPPPLDHNLIAEARRLLVTELEWALYECDLAAMAHGFGVFGYMSWFKFILNATPEQHAEAILKALE